MPEFSARSRALLATVHPSLRRLLDRAIEGFDFTVLPSTVRTVEEQAEFVRTGRSKTMASKHLPQADGFIHAVDVAPWYTTEPHIRLEDREMLHLLAGYVVGLAEELDVRVRWGGDWLSKRTNRPTDRWDDLLHYELLP